MSQLNVLHNQARLLALRAQKRVGINGIAGGVLAVAALTAAVLAQLNAADLANLNQKIAEARTQLATQPVRTVVEDLGPKERMRQFQAWFPLAGTAPADLRKIYQAAVKNHVALSKGEYSMTNIDGSGGLQKYDVIFPVKNNYGDLKGFVAQVLNTLPHAGLTELRAERPASMVNELDARVHFTLYYRTPAV
jgi:hypothetical protein